MIVGVSWSFCFLFKQKTAYDMRISDWSSDVCSSDLLYISNGWIDLDAGFSSKNRNAFPYDWRFRATLALEDPAAGKQRDRRHRRCQAHRFIHLHGPHFRPEHRRSEEHTSELQSLMRISYAVFCLTKNNTTSDPKTQDQQHTTQPRS